MAEDIKVRVTGGPFLGTLSKEARVQVGTSQVSRCLDTDSAPGRESPSFPSLPHNLHQRPEKHSALTSLPGSFLPVRIWVVERENPSTPECSSLSPRLGPLVW